MGQAVLERTVQQRDEVGFVVADRLGEQRMTGVVEDVSEVHLLPDEQRPGPAGGTTTGSRRSKRPAARSPSLGRTIAEDTRRAP
jgi:hypothetical protein